MAVNLTDGLDGLATVPVILVAGCFAFISYVSGNIIFAEYLLIPYIEGVGEVAVFCGAIIGASIGFLWFKLQQKLFMGDTGSVALGGSLDLIMKSWSCYKTRNSFSEQQEMSKKCFRSSLCYCTSYLI